MVLLIQSLYRRDTRQEINRILSWPFLLDTLLAVILAAANFATAYAGYRVTVNPILPSDVGRRRKMEIFIWSSFAVSIVAIVMAVIHNGQTSQRLVDTVVKGNQTIVATIESTRTPEGTRTPANPSEAATSIPVSPPPKEMKTPKAVAKEAPSTTTAPTASTATQGPQISNVSSAFELDGNTNTLDIDLNFENFGDTPTQAHMETRVFFNSVPASINSTVPNTIAFASHQLINSHLKFTLSPDLEKLLRSGDSVCAFAISMEYPDREGNKTTYVYEGKLDMLSKRVVTTKSAWQYSRGASEHS